MAIFNKKRETIEKTYVWRGVNAFGQRVSGECRVMDLSFVKKELYRRDIIPLFIRKKIALQFLVFAKDISKKEIADFVQQFATLIDSSVHIIAALDIVKKGCRNPAMQNLIAHIERDIEQGNTLSDALQKYPNYFSELFYNLVRVGEQSGTLDIMLIYLVSHQQRVEMQRRALKKILLYPIFILFFVLSITYGLLMLVVPTLQEMFANFDITLPLYTRYIINLATFVRDRSWVLFGGIGCWILVCVWAQRNIVWCANFFDLLKLRLPYFGSVIKKTILTRIARTLAVIFKAGIPLNHAFAMVANIVDNFVYKRGLLEVSEKISCGQMLNAAMEEVGIFPLRVLQLVVIGEESGTLDDMFIKIADYYEGEVNYISDNMNRILEPLIMMVLGLLVGGIVIGMYLPIFQLGKVL